MAIEDEVLALAGTVERANHVGPIGLCRAVGDGHALRPQTVVQKSGGKLGIARRIGARFGDEVRQKLHEEAAIAIDPGQQLIVMWRHASILLAPLGSCRLDPATCPRPWLVARAWPRRAFADHGTLRDIA